MKNCELEQQRYIRQVLVRLVWSNLAPGERELVAKPYYEICRLISQASSEAELRGIPLERLNRTNRAFYPGQ